MTQEERLEPIVRISRNAQRWHRDQADALLAHREIIEKMADYEYWKGEEQETDNG